MADEVDLRRQCSSTCRLYGVAAFGSTQPGAASSVVAGSSRATGLSLGATSRQPELQTCSCLILRAEIVSLGFNTGGDLIVTGSFDHDSRLWDVRTGQCVHVLSGHRGEVSSTQFNYAGEAGEEAVGGQPKG